MWDFDITWRLSSVNLSHFNLLLFPETHQPNELKLSRKHLWKVLSKGCTFCYAPLPNMAIHRQFLFLIDPYLKKSSPLKLPSQMNRNLAGSIYMYGRFCIKFLQSRMKGERHRLSPLSL